MFDYILQNRIITLIILKLAMQRQKSQPRSKANSKAVGTKKGKQSKMVKQKIMDVQIDSESIKEYYENLRSKISSYSSNLEPKIEVGKLFRAFKMMPTETLALLVQLYLNFPAVFYQYTKDSTAQQIEARPICQFLHLILKNITIFPFMQREKTITIYENILKWLHQKSISLNEKQLLLLNQSRSSLCTTILQGEIDRLVQNSFMFVLKLTLILGEKSHNKLEMDFSEENTGALMVTIAYIFQSNKKISSDVENTILDFHKNSFRILILNVINPIKVYPFFDIAMMCFTSKKGDICKKIINQTFSMLKILIDERRQQMRQSTDSKSLQEVQHKINGILLVSSFLKFNSVFQPSILSKKAMLMKQVNLLTLITFKSSILKLVDQLQKLQKTSIPPEIIRGMFQISKYCNNINKQNVLSSVVNKIMSHRQLSSHLLNEQKIVFSPKQQETLQTINKNLQKYLFQIMYRIQKTLCHYNLQVFMDLYVEHPLTFRSEYFVEQTFKHQHQQVILHFMKALTSKWLLVDIKIFDFTFYLLHFIKKCINEDKIGTLGRFLRQIKIQQLTRINLMIYKLSFEEDKKKYSIPDCCYGLSQLSSMTSAGYAEKYHFVNQLMPSFSEQLLWKRFAGQLASSNHYYVVKSFYSVVNYEWIVGDQTYDKVYRLVGYFQECINMQQMEEMYSTFQLLYCILFSYSGRVNTQESSQKIPVNTQENKLKEKCCGRLLQIIINKGDNIINMHELVCNRRRSAMNTVVLSSEMVTQNLRYFQTLKKMNSTFLKSLHKWCQSLKNIKQLITSKLSYQNVIQTFLQFCKNYQYRQYHQIRYLSYFCSQKYFNNIIFMKIKTKIMKREMLPSSNLMVLKEVIDNFIGKYEGEEICNQYCIKETEVMGYYAYVLGFQIGVVNQREILKSKVIVLQQIVQMNLFFEKRQGHQHFDQYHQLFHQSIKNIIIEIVHQNPLFVSKYERQFMIHLRTIALKEILRAINTQFQILDLQNCYHLVFSSCLDKNIQIRFLIINILCSRFKTDIYHRFLSDKYQIATFLTIIQIFDANVSLNSVAKRMIERFKQAGKDCCFLGLIILLYSIKHILTYCGKNFMKEEYCTFVDHFIGSFEKLWLTQKETEYMSYLFSTQFIEQGRMEFILNIPSKQSFIQPYNITKGRSDYLLENEIKQYLRKEQQYSFQLPSQQQIPTFKSKLINNMIQSLPYRIFSKVKKVIQQKPRNTRILRYKKDVLINWKMLEERKLIRNYQERKKIEVIKLSL